MRLIEAQSLYSKDVVVLLLLKTEQFLPHMTQVIGLSYLVIKEITLTLNYSLSCSHTKLYIYNRLRHAKRGNKGIIHYRLTRNDLDGFYG